MSISTWLLMLIQNLCSLWTLPRLLLSVTFALSDHNFTLQLKYVRSNAYTFFAIYTYIYMDFHYISRSIPSPPSTGYLHSGLHVAHHKLSLSFESGHSQRKWLSNWN